MPYQGEPDGLLVFSTDVTVTGDAELEYDYIFTVENKDTGKVTVLNLTVEEGQTYVVLGRLPRGSYFVTKREDIRRDSNGFIPVETDNARFYIAAGEVSVARHIRIVKGKDIREVEVSVPTNDEGRELFELQLSTQEAFQGWNYHPTLIENFSMF
ncbi:hypothetical protein THO17_34380 [Marinomonas sp. THO17]